MPSTNLNTALTEEEDRVSYQLSDELADVFRAQSFRREQFRAVGAVQNDPPVFWDELFFNSWNSATARAR